LIYGTLISDGTRISRIATGSRDADLAGCLKLTGRGSRLGSACRAQPTARSARSASRMKACAIRVPWKIRAPSTKKNPRDPRPVENPVNQEESA